MNQQRENEPGITGVPEASGHDHHGHDDGRDTLTAGESQHELSGADEQALPAMSQNNADDIDKLSGIVAQTRADLPDAPIERIVELLQKRTEQAGLNLGQEELAALAAHLADRDD